MNNVTEQELKDSAARTGGRRVTLEALEANIKSEHYFTALEGVIGETFMRGARAGEQPAPLAIMTFCILVLQNGFTVTGQSACADPANYNKDIGQRLARTDATGKMWPLMGYALKEELAREQELLDALAFATPLAMTYIGTKMVVAMSMNRLEYNKFRGWTLPENENGADEGYLVEYTDRIETPPHVKGFKGYISWSPKEVFERAYRPVRQGAPATASAPTAG